MIKSGANAGRPFDLVLLDWRMPDMDGIQTAEKIKALGLEAPPHLLLITAYGREDVLQQADRFGFEEVLIKPINPSIMFESASRILGERDGDEVVSGPVPSPRRNLAIVHGTRVLLVEDNELNQQVAAELLGEAGCIVTIAENGKVAVDKARAQMDSGQPFDIIFMDVQMPVMDGFAATAEIRKFGFVKPIVAMTANAMEGDRERCLAADMNDHVAKPIEPEDLWDALLRWVKRDEAAPTTPMSPALPAPAKPAPAAAGGALNINIAGLDSVGGLRRVLGKAAIYHTLLKRFASDQAGFEEQIKTAINAEDWPTAQRVAHTLKGVAGNIGAIAVQEPAQRLEASLRKRESRDQFDPFLAETVAALNAMIAGLNAALGEPAGVPASAAKPVDHRVLGDAAQRLAALLAQYDTTASDVLDEQREILSAGLGAAFARIEASVRQFAFDDAMNGLKQAMRDSGIPL
jgi:CheY-like chemotaxis protein